MSRAAVAILALSVVSVCAPAFADTHYVSHDGSNTYPYDSWARATDSILLAIDAADEWDTVRLATGVFTADTLGLKKGMVFVGASRDSTRIVHNGNARQCIYLLDSCVLEGFYLQGITDTAMNGDITFHLLEGVVANPDQSALVRNCRISDVERAIQAFWTDQVYPSKRVVIENNEFSNFREAVRYWYCSSRVSGNKFFVDYSNIASTVTQFEGNAEIYQNVFIKSVGFSFPAIRLERCDTIWIRNNICVSTVDTGHAIGINSEVTGYPTGGAIENNLCLGGWAGIFSNGGNIRIRNNIVGKTTLWALYYDTLSTTPGYVGFNLYWDNEHQFSGDMALRPDPGNLFANPMFVDSMDFHLQAFSPAIDAGDPSVLDADGSRSDIGPYGGPLGETYAYQDFAPAAPANLLAVWQDSLTAVSWTRNSEADLYVYRLYRDSFPVILPNPLLMVAEIGAADSLFLDPTDLRGETVYYRLSAVDAQGHESVLGQEVVLSVSGVGGDDESELPRDFVLHPNYPNPFNASTRFEIDVPEAGRVYVSVHDILGRRLETLHDGVLPVGRHTFDWGAEDAGSGMYFIVVKFGESTRVRKALLLK